jgi:hypothetical protein
MNNKTLSSVNVTRATVLQHITERLKDFEDPDQATGLPIINMHGIAGIGKTYAIRQLYTTFESRYDVIWLGFDPLELKRTSEEEKRFIMPLAEAIDTLERLPVLQGQLDIPEYDEPIEVFCRATPANNRPLLVLLDALDDLSVWKWVQEAIIKPLCEQKLAVVVCTSQSPLFWDYWELRDWCEEYPLEVFDKQEIAQYFDKCGLDNLNPLIDTFCDYTQGYPLAVSNFADEIIKNSLPGGDRDAHPALPEKLSVNERKLLGYVGVMRLAEIDVMRQLLRSLPVEHNDYPPPSLTLLTTLLKKLQTGGFLHSGRQDLPKQLTPQLRQAVKESIDAEAPGRYTLLCEKLERTYFHLAKEKPKTIVHACIEWLYFSSELPLDSEELREAWSKNLHVIVTHAIDVNTEVIKHVRTDDLVPADASLVVLFYRDQELIKKLKGLKLFHYVDSLMQEFLSTIRSTLQTFRLNADLEIKELTALPLRIDFNNSCSKVLTSLSERLPIGILSSATQDKRDFNVTMRTFLIKPDDIDIDRLRKQTSHSSTFLSPKQLSEILAVFNSRGLLLYDRSRRTYQFHHLIKHLVSFADEWSELKAAPVAVGALLS